LDLRLGNIAKPHGNESSGRVFKERVACLKCAARGRSVSALYE